MINYVIKFFILTYMQYINLFNIEINLLNKNIIFYK
jgi:hypothetical protein